MDYSPIIPNIDSVSNTFTFNPDSNLKDKGNIILNVTVYITLFSILKFAISREKSDLYCPEGPDTKDKSLCKDGNGKIYAKYKYSPDDKGKPIESLKKLSKLGNTHSVEIIWRRCIIIALISTLVLNIVTKGSLPNGPELLGGTIIIWTLLYVSFHYYRCHHQNLISEEMDKHIRNVMISISNQ